MKCPNCGNELSNNAIFCNNCGREVPARSKNADKIFCSNCGAELKSGTEFCGNCATPVSISQPVIEDKPKKNNNAILIIIIFVVLITVFAAIITAYTLYLTNNKSISDDMNNSQEPVSSTPIPQSTPSPTAEPDGDASKNEDISRRNMISNRVDLYNSALTYKRMPEIHNTVLVDDNTFEALKNVINEFDVQCADYMNEIIDEAPRYLKPGTTAYNQQVEYKQKHPTLNQTYQTIDVINARQGGGYYYVWVTEIMNVNENGEDKATTDHWVYKIEKDNGNWYICDYTSDPAF